MKRKSLEGSLCAIARSLDLIGDWWSLLIVRDALAGIRRFVDFQRSLGAPKNILTARLKTLVAQGILELAPTRRGAPAGNMCRPRKAAPCRRSSWRSSNGGARTCSSRVNRAPFWSMR